MIETLIELKAELNMVDNVSWGHINVVVFILAADVFMY